jgi:hypothetical protein
VGDQNQRGAVFAVERKQQIGNLIPGLAVEVTGGSSANSTSGRPLNARQRHALLLAAGKLRREMVKAFAKPQLPAALWHGRLSRVFSPRNSAGSSTFSSAFRVGISMKD